MRNWLEVGKEEMDAFLKAQGQPAFRAKQLRDWMHGKRVDAFDKMRNLPAGLRDTLAAEGSLRTLYEIERRDAADGLTAKWLLGLPEFRDTPAALTECVLIIEKQRTRRTVCASSMSGCPLGCVFCATGRHGFVRNLSEGEIIEQVYRVDAHCRQEGQDAGVSHVVFMGMGEPLLNLDAVLAAAAAFADPCGLGLSGRHITISTAGVPDGIRRLAAAGVNYRLALSLHAPDQALREKLMPAARRWPLDEVFSSLEQFAAVASRDITFEYCLVDGVNASPKQARQLAEILIRFRAKANLIPLNPVDGYPERPPSPAAVLGFFETLTAAGARATVRTEKGADIGAACGQLRANRLS